MKFQLHSNLKLKPTEFLDGEFSECLFNSVVIRCGFICLFFFFSLGHDFINRREMFILKRKRDEIILIWIFAGDWLRTCQIDDPNFEACSRESIQGLFSQLTKGEWILVFFRYIFFYLLSVLNDFLTHIHICDA